MKKIITTMILGISLFTTVSHANVEPEFRAYYYETGNTYQCNQVYWAVKGTICYVLVDGNLKSMGYGMLQRWTGTWDALGAKIFEGDRVRNPNGTEGIIMFSDTDYTRTGAIGYYGWYIRNESGDKYPFRDMGSSAKETLSTVIPHVYVAPQPTNVTN